MALSVQNKHFMTIDNINHRNNPQQREKIFLLGTFLCYGIWCKRWMINLKKWSKTGGLSWLHEVWAGPFDWSDIKEMTRITNTKDRHTIWVNEGQFIPHPDDIEQAVIDILYFS